MIEIFKTNVGNAGHAKQLVRMIHEHFSHLKANFDLEDCDRILRVKFNGTSLNVEVVISFLETLGVHAEILQDELSPRNR